MAKKITIPNVTLSIVWADESDGAPNDNLLPKEKNLGYILEDINWNLSKNYEDQGDFQPCSVVVEADIDTMLSKYPGMITIEDYEEE